MTIVAALALLASGHPPGMRPVYREIGDWLVACDNTRACVAKYAPDPSGTAGADSGAIGVTIMRDAGAGGALEIAIQAEARFDPAELRIDGAADERLWQIGEDGLDARLRGQDALDHLRRLRGARSLSMPGGTTVSLRGLAAVLLAIDAAQGRVGNGGAIVRPGARDTGTTPAAPQPPIVARGPVPATLKDPAGLIRATRRHATRALAAHECDRVDDTEDSAAALNADLAIVLIGCGRFAYQSSVLAFLVPRARPAAARLLDLATPLPAAPPDARSAGEYVGGSYDPDTAVFSEYAKGRGMADCGISTDWTFDGGRFRLSGFSYQQRCAGMAGDWPVLFRSRPR